MIVFLKGAIYKGAKFMNKRARLYHEDYNDLFQGIFLLNDGYGALGVLIMPRSIITLINKLETFRTGILINKVNSYFWRVNRIGFLPILFYLPIRKYNFF